MANDPVVEIVNEFFQKTCQLRRPLNLEAFKAMWSCSFTSAVLGNADIIPLSTGSVAEFYIEPMLSCMGDADIMYHHSFELAIPQGHLPPTQLPAEFHGLVNVYEIIDSKFPGYVYLVRSYLLTEITDDGKYKVVQCQRQYKEHTFRYLGLVLHVLRYCEQDARLRGENAHVRVNQQGPAMAMARELTNHMPSVLASVHSPKSLLSMDGVPCTRCLSWPSQAADWPTRHRNYGWPDSATVDRVVSNGCDLVGVAHRLCRHDEWMSKHQYRLSFSRAEIALINSWVPVQQIVYHMLRSFMKIESLTDITDNTGSKILSNYNIKTLMLWASEVKAGSWWIGELNVVGICVKLLHILADWLTNARCPHYFINNCNLFDSLDNSLSHLTLPDKLMSLTEAWLAEWFVNNYIRKCVDLSPSRVSRLFDDISTHGKLQNAVSALVGWRMSLALASSLSYCFVAQFLIDEMYRRFPRTIGKCLYWVKELLGIDERLSQHLIHRQECQFPSVQSCLFWIRQLSKNDEDECLLVYFTAVTFLHVVSTTNRNPLTDEMLDILSTVCLQSNNVRRCLKARHSSVLSLGKAITLMNVIANNSRSTVQLIEIELSKAYLYRALRCKDSDSDSIYCLANVDHCTVVTRSHDHSHCRSYTVQGELMPKIDDDIDAVLGLAVFYQYVRTVALNQQQQTQHVSVFSTELFAHYLHIRCQSVVKCRQFTQMSSADEVQRYEKCFSESSQMFVTDVIVFALVARRKYKANSAKPTSSRERTKPVMSGQLDTSELVELLHKSAVEHLTTVRRFQVRQFGSVGAIVTTDFESLYAYKRGEYQRCLQLSTQNVHTLIGGAGIISFLPYSEFIQLMDDDLVCLTGLSLLVNRSLKEDARHIAISQLSLSLYLMTQCQMKLYHPVASLAHALDYVEVARRKLLNELFKLDHLLLKLTEYKVLRYMISVGCA